MKNTDVVVVVVVVVVGVVPIQKAVDEERNPKHTKSSSGSAWN